MNEKRTGYFLGAPYNNLGEKEGKNTQEVAGQVKSGKDSCTTVRTEMVRKNSDTPKPEEEKGTLAKKHHCGKPRWKKTHW